MTASVTGYGALLLEMRPALEERVPQIDHRQRGAKTGEPAVVGEEVLPEVRLVRHRLRVEQDRQQERHDGAE